MKKHTLDDIKQKSIARYGDIYDFSKAVYIDSDTEMLIGCPIHGFNMFKPALFIRSKMGCSFCGIESKRLDISVFTKRAIAKYGDEFDLTYVKYINMETTVTIFCSNHGEFDTTPQSFLTSVYGCPKCAIERTRNSTEDIVKMITDKHDGKFDCSRVIDAVHTEITTIGCPTHGWFDITPKDFLNTHHGCNDCWLESRNFTTDEWIAIARDIHGDKYGYPEGDFYTNSKTKITIYCREHDYYFDQLPNKHIGKQQQGCPLYHRSRGEEAVGAWLQENNIPFDAQKTFPDCVDKARLRFDFEVLFNNKYILIEFNGEQHYKELGGYYEGELEGIQRRDNIKLNYCIDNNIPLLIIKYDEDVTEVLSNYFT